MSIQQIRYGALPHTFFYWLEHWSLKMMKTGTYWEIVRIIFSSQISMDQIPYLQYSIQYHHEIFKLLYPAWSITALHGSHASSYASVSNEGVYTVYQCAYVNSSIINNCQSYQCKISSNLHLLTLFTLSQLLLTVLPYWRKENHDAWNAQPNVWNFPADFQGTLCYIESEPNLKLSLKFPVNDVCMLDYFLLPLDNYKHFWAFYM